MSRHVVVTDIARADAQLVDAFVSLGSATVHEALGRTGYAGSAIRPIQQGAAIAGSAVTVLTAPGDNLMVHVAIEQARAGDVIVVVATGPSPFGHIGELMATQMQVKGVRGYVTSAGVRDTSELRAMGFPAWSRYVSAQGCLRDSPGSVNVPVVLDGVVVEPGDIVVADDDGVTVVPRTQAASVRDAARARATREATNRAKYEAGASSMDINGLRSVVAELGVSFVSRPERRDADS